MTTPPRLTDRAALMRQRRRAAMAPVLFVQEHVARDVEERLRQVNRRFTSPAVITPWPDLWRDILPEALLVDDDEVLALREGAHDLVIHALCLHWADDPLGQIIQCARALKPDGLFIATLFGGQTLAPLRQALTEAEAAALGGASPRLVPMGEIRPLGGLLQRAGLALPVADGEVLRASYADPLALMRELRAMGEGNALAARHRGLTPASVLLGAAARYPAEADGRALAEFEIITLTGWAPGPGQQEPLRPGSAAMRLEEALTRAQDEET